MDLKEVREIVDFEKFHIMFPSPLGVMDLKVKITSSSKFQDTDIVKRHEPCLGHATVAVKKYCYEWVWLISTDLA